MAVLGRTHGHAPPTTGRGGVCLAQSVRSRSAAFCAPLVLQLGPWVLPMLGHFGPPLQASLIHMAS